MSHLRHLAKLPTLKPPAYCKARMRLPLRVLQTLVRRTADAMREKVDGNGPDGSFLGLRVLLLDGSSTIAPDTPASQRAFGQPSNQKPGCGFPVPRVVALFDAFSGLALQVLGFPLLVSEMRALWEIHPLLRAGRDLLVADRGLCSFAHLALLRLRDVHALFRMMRRADIRFDGRDRGPWARSRRVRRLGAGDQLAEWRKPKPSRRPPWMSVAQYATLPDTLVVRELCYPLVRPGYRTRTIILVTTLLDPIRFPHGKLAELYAVRWQAETHFAQLKTTLRMRRLKSRTPDGVLKELAVYMLVYNLVRVVMLQAARRQHVEPSRISFLDTVRWLLSAFSPNEIMPPLLVNPRRKGRHEPRVIKDLRADYRKMTRPRHVLRQRLDPWRGKPK